MTAMNFLSSASFQVLRAQMLARSFIDINSGRLHAALWRLIFARAATTFTRRPRHETIVMPIVDIYGVIWV